MDGLERQLTLAAILNVGLEVRQNLYIWSFFVILNYTLVITEF
jgi:hypothetical protein